MESNGSEAHFDHAVKLSIEGLKSLFLLNGGAATALIALTDKTSGRPDYSVPIVLFGIASFLAVLTFVVGYFSQLSYANYRFSVENDQYTAADQAIDRHVLYQRIGICLVCLSLVASGTAMAFSFERAKTTKIQYQLRTCDTVNATTEAKSLPTSSAIAVQKSSVRRINH